MAFCSIDWDLMLPNCVLQAISSNVYDHSPLLLIGNAARKTYRGFRFEVFWPRLNGVCRCGKGCLGQRVAGT